MDRRQFLQATATTASTVAADRLAVGAIGAAGASLAITMPNEHAAASATPFPSTFWWGAAAAAYQLEGGATADGRGPSIWDTFSHTPGKVANGDTGDVATDHYHRYVEDVKLMADLGVKHYRFSISWSRVIPQGTGTVNEKGVDFYQRLVDELLKHGITPHATLFHWDLPQALQDKYKGWQNRQVADDYAAYAGLVAKRLGDRVTRWMTLNEILTFTNVGYSVGYPGPHAPGIQLSRRKERWQISHHALLAHGLGAQAIRANASKPPKIAIAENYSPYVPVIETPEHINAARLAFTRSEANGSILTPLLAGKYDDFWWAKEGAEVPDVKDGDLKTIHQPLDGLGFNCYTGTYVKAAQNAQGYEEVPQSAKYPRMGADWLTMVPESIYWGIRLIREAYGLKTLPIFISENGCADMGPTSPNAEVQDVERVLYLRAYLRQVQRAVNEGYPVVGYFPWSLMDNFEWAEGYNTRFGLVYVDYPTQKRIPKLSYKWYKEVIRTRTVV